MHTLIHGLTRRFARAGLVTTLFAALAAAPSAATIKPESAQIGAARVIAELLQRFHYSRPELTDALSSQMLDRYLDTLDRNKHFFLQSDITSFEAYRFQLDDSLREAEISPAYKIYNLYTDRVGNRVQYALKMLAEPHDFSLDEQYPIDYEGRPWLGTVAALNDLWRRRVKSDILNLRLDGKTAEEITETLTERYQRILKRVDQHTAIDVFQMYIGAYTGAIDPHTSYFSPHNSENFNINMRLSLEGIGASLSTEKEHTVVRKVIPGGPAHADGRLQEGDRIVGVAQGEDGEMTDVVGWRLRDVVDLIRGPKRSVVRLSLLPERVGEDGPRHEIQLVRDKVRLEERAAKSSIIEVGAGPAAMKVGVIELPIFYMDFEARARGTEDYRSSTRDVKTLIDGLQQQDIDGLLIDLRNNAGGSMLEATELTGLFISEGPVVQVRNTRGRIRVNEDEDAAVAYDGPLAVLVNRNSASSSEIFAAAIQDYSRGIIIGETTFGKGTVQTIYDLDDYARDERGKLGQIKVTIAQYFRINGDSTQHRGVRPDIPLPAASVDGERGERALDNALPWAQVRPAEFTETQYRLGLDMDYLRDRHRLRVTDDAGFEYLAALGAESRKARERKAVSLNEATRKQERQDLRRRTLALENRFRKSRGLPPLPPEDGDSAAQQGEDSQDDEARVETPLLAIELDEAANILADHIGKLRAPYASNIHDEAMR